MMMKFHQITLRIAACEEMLKQPQTRSGYTYLIARVMTLDEIVGAPERDLRTLFPFVPLRPAAVQFHGIEQDSTSGAQGVQSLAVPPSQPSGETSINEGVAR